MGLLMCTHSERLARATRSEVSDDVCRVKSEKEGRASEAPRCLVIFCELERVSKKAGDGASVDAVGRR